ncbi:hypothetical protein GUITHDRAFT_99195 [Guillardia theta CCMP2712]|uniref:Sfi1 spindle body domain-containing protein n=1 Tax=Guillardia theta (strain CCMP2712) TaxID=905079 RepID=L1K4A9_GUITC|nr:hypothetical protein GUITHDRAFT_99195 [Guillardia theta CCMP2712]EKX55417.1 hypothetical protein GUITHDRAFT_99195 [Guillardia theta CCMP2712]|eukprot:XP_005842397.1 hypothetical protein GUITHDRAFT_99195 [Guillardia theta CCMP2712]
MTNRVDYDLNSSIETSTASVRRGQAFLKTLAEAESALFSDHAENSISFLVPPTKRAQRKLHLESNEESTMFNTTIESTISEFSTASHVKSIDKREYELRRELKKKDGEILHARMFNKTLQEHLAANETNLDVLQRNLEKVAQKDRESGSKILQLEGYIHSRDEQFSELQAKYQTLKACFDEMMESATAKQHELQAKVASEVKKGSELADSIGRLQTEVDGLRRKEEMLERERDELLKDVEEMKVEMSKLEQACSGERRKLEERDEELAERKEALRTLHASCDEQALKLQYHDEIEATMGARIEELKEALRIQEQELREVRRESGAAMRKAFANFDAFLVQHVVKMQRHRVAHLMFLTWALSAKSKVLRMGHFLKSLQRKVSAHDVMKISFNAMRPESRTSLMKVVVKGQEKSIMAASFSEWRKRVKNLNVMKRIGVNFVSYNLQVILRGWKRLCKARKMSQSALMASRAGLLQSAFCQLKSIVSTKNLWRKKEMALSSKRMRMTVVEMFASWLHVKDSEKKLKNLLLRWNMGQGVSCSRRYFSMWSHAIYSQISFSNRLKRAAFMRSKFSLITVRTMMAAWRRHVGILVKCRRSFKERMRGDVGVCFEKLSVNAQEMKEGRLRLQNLRMRKGQNQLKVLFGGWKDHLFEMQHRLNIMARTLSLVFQKHLQLSFQTWAAVTSMSRRHLVAQSKINDRSSRSCLKFHFSSLARHARTIGLRRRKVQALFSRILLRLLATLTSSWRTLMTRSKVCRKKSSDMMVAKSVRMKNFAFHTLLGFADDKVKARHVCDKVERVRRRGLQVLCWLSLSKKVADSRVMFSRLEAMKMRRLFAGWRKSILFIKMCCEVKFNVTSSLSAKRKLLYRHLTGWREVRGVLLSFRAMYHVMVVEKQNKSQEVLMSKKEKDRQAFLSVLLQINDPQQSSKVNLGMSAFACWLATFHQKRHACKTSKLHEMVGRGHDDEEIQEALEEGEDEGWSSVSDLLYESMGLPHAQKSDYDHRMLAVRVEKTLEGKTECPESMADTSAC